DHLVSASRKCRWNFQSECFCGLQVDDELEVGGLRHWQVFWLFAFKDAGCITAYLSIGVRQHRPITHQAALDSMQTPFVDRWQPVLWPARLVAHVRCKGTDRP